MAKNSSLEKESSKSPPTYASRASTNESQFMTKQFKVRKSPHKLGSRAIYNSTSAVESFGDKNALFYLESALKKLKKRNRNEFEEWDINDEEDESGEESGEDVKVTSL